MWGLVRESFVREGCAGALAAEVRDVKDSGFLSSRWSQLCHQVVYHQGVYRQDVCHQGVCSQGVSVKMDVVGWWCQSRFRIFLSRLE